MTTILETNLTIQGNRMNIITKKVTSWAAIIAVPYIDPRVIEVYATQERPSPRRSVSSPTRPAQLGIVLRITRSPVASSRARGGS